MTRRSATLSSKVALAICTTGCVLTPAAHAAGFFLIEQSVSGMGTAYASGAAHGEDNSAMFFNPASMVLFDGTQTSAGTHVVIPQSKFKDDGSTFATALGGGSLGNREGGDAGKTGIVPHAAVSHRLTNDTWVGLAINAPFGLTTDYKRGWVGRYHALKSELKSVNINPSVAHKLSDDLTIGAGLSAQYVDATLSQAIDFGTIAGLAPGSADGEAEVQGDSWGWGFNLGLLWQATPSTRIGVQYRSEIDQNVKGKAKFYGGAQAAVAAATGNTQFVKTNVKADVTLPATASLSIHHQLDTEWAIVGDYTWFGWGKFDELRFEFDSAQADSVTTFNWNDTSRVAAGMLYTPNGSDWTYRFGAAFDESPIPNAEHRTPRLPGADRIWVAVGAGYSPSPNLRFDFGYAHLFVDDPEIDKTASLAPMNEDGLRGSLKGSYDASVDILSAQLMYTF